MLYTISFEISLPYAVFYAMHSIFFSSEFTDGLDAIGREFVVVLFLSLSLYFHVLFALSQHVYYTFVSASAQHIVKCHDFVVFYLSSVLADDILF